MKLPAHILLALTLAAPAAALADGLAPTLAETVASYAWHGRHHLAHIEHLAAREKWTSLTKPPTQG